MIIHYIVILDCLLTSVCLLTGICRTLPWWLRARDPPQVHTHWLSASPPRLHLARNYDNQFSVIFQLTFVHPDWRTERKKQASLSYRFVGRREIPLLKECVCFWKRMEKNLFSAEERRLGWNDLRSLLVEWFKLSWRSVGGTKFLSGEKTDGFSRRNKVVNYEPNCI